LGEGDFSSFPESVFSLSLLYIVAVIANLLHPAIPSPYVIPSFSVILRERSDRRISWLRINSAKNLVFVFRINPVRNNLKK
jgi:hypothetical protein